MPPKRRKRVAPPKPPLPKKDIDFPPPPPDQKVDPPSPEDALFLFEQALEVPADHVAPGTLYVLYMTVTLALLREIAAKEASGPDVLRELGERLPYNIAKVENEASRAKWLRVVHQIKDAIGSDDTTDVLEIHYRKLTRAPAVSEPVSLARAEHAAKDVIEIVSAQPRPGAPSGITPEDAFDMRDRILPTTSGMSIGTIARLGMGAAFLAYAIFVFFIPTANGLGFFTRFPTVIGSIKGVAKNALADYPMALTVGKGLLTGLEMIGLTSEALSVAPTSLFTSPLQTTAVPWIEHLGFISAGFIGVFGMRAPIVMASVAGYASVAAMIGIQIATVIWPAVAVAGATAGLYTVGESAIGFISNLFWGNKGEMKLLRGDYSELVRRHGARAVRDAAHLREFSMPEKLEKRDEALRLEDKEIGRMPLSERREKIAAREDRDEHNEKWDREDGADAIKLWDTVDPFAQGMSPRYAGPQTLHESIFYSEMSGFGENYVPPPDPDADTVPDDTGFAAEPSGWLDFLF